MAIHTIKYKDIELTIIGNYEKPEEETGYKGGWLSDSILCGGQNILPIIHDLDLEAIDEQILNENY